MPLTGKTAVVAGGAGGVGEGIVRTLLQNGATVVVPVRTQAKIVQLTDYTADLERGQLLALEANIGTEAGARQVGDFLADKFKGGLDLVVASLGGWTQGLPLTAIDLTSWNRILANNLTSHFLAIKTLVPLLIPNRGIYVHVNGFSAEQAYPNAGPVAMAAAAQKSLVTTLADEVKPLGLTVYELILGPIKTRDRLRHGHGRRVDGMPDWLFPEDVGDYIVSLVTGRNEKADELIHRLVEKGSM